MEATAKELGAFKGDPALKALAITEMREHKHLDQLARGHYWEASKNSGCAIGCMAGVEVDGPHAYVAEKLGLPEGLLRIVDSLFENIPNGEHLDWPVEFLKAVPVGANLDLVYPRYMHELVMDPKWGLIELIRKTEGTPEELAQVEAFAGLYRAWYETGERPPHASWELSAQHARAAWDAWAAWAAWAARAARAARAAWDAWDAWDARAARAAWDAWDAWAAWDAWDAWDAYVLFERDILLKLLKEA